MATRGTTSTFAVVATTALVLGLAGCGDNGADDTAPTPSIGESSKAGEPTSEPAPGPGAIPTSFPEVGLEITDLPKLDDAYHDALVAFVDFERGRRATLNEAKLNPLLSDNAAGRVVEKFQGTVDYLQANNSHYRGDVTTEVVEAETKPGVLWLETCTDGTGLRIVENGQPTPVSGEPRLSARIVVTDVDGTWLVTDDTSLEGSC